MCNFTELMPADFYVFDSKKDGERKDVNGYYIDGTIYIGISTETFGENTVLFTLSHELVHYIKDWSPAKFSVLAEFLFNEYAENGVDVQQLIDNKVEELKEIPDYKDISAAQLRDIAYEEIVADACQRMLLDSNVVERLAKLKKRDSNLYNKVKEFIKSFCQKIMGRYKTLKPQSLAAKHVDEIPNLAQKLSSLFEDALVDAVETHRIIGAQKNTAQSGARYSYAGQKATKKPSMLQEAIEMETKGVDSETIRQKTGWFKSYDGMWRFEIDDSAMQIKPINKGANVYTLGDLIIHDALFNAYPSLNSMKVEVTTLKNASASYNVRDKIIRVDKKILENLDDTYTENKFKEVLIHEIQHAIQDIEGFTGGATLGYWENLIYNSIDSMPEELFETELHKLNELNRILEANPQFFKDMATLFGETKIILQETNDVSVNGDEGEVSNEWQEFNKHRDQMFEKYGQIEVFNCIRLMNELEEGIKNKALKFYLNTAGEIEARDVSSRIDMTEEQRKNTRPDIDRKDVMFAEGSAENYSVEYSENGNPVVVVEDNILQGIPKNQWAKTVKTVIAQKFTNGIPISGRLIKVNKKTREEFTNSKYTKYLRDNNGVVYQDKLRSANNIDEIILASVNYINEDLNHKRTDNIKEFARGEVLIQVDGNQYISNVIVGITTSDNMILYDVIDFTPTKFSIKKESTPDGQKSIRSGMLSNNSIPIETESVNTKFQYKSDANYMDAAQQYLNTRSKDSLKAVQEIVDEYAEAAMPDSKVRDENGKLLKVYHGTEAENFNVFDKARRGQTDSSLWGRGYYFSSDFDFASNFGDNIRSFYLDIKNPFIVEKIDAPASVIADRLKAAGVEIGFDYKWLKAFEFAKKFDSQKFADTLVSLGYDGVIVEDFEYVTFNRNQMKLSDAITYDDNGEVIPLSERFDSSKKDIRYQPKKNNNNNIYYTKNRIRKVANNKKGKYNKNTTYDELATIAMQWAYSSATNDGDLKIIHKNMKTAALFMATESGYVELCRGTIKKVEEEYERAYKKAVNEVYGNLESIRDDQGRDIWNMHVLEIRRNDDRDPGRAGETELSTYPSRGNEYSRKGSTEEPARVVVRDTEKKFNKPQHKSLESLSDTELMARYLEENSEAVKTVLRKTAMVEMNPVTLTRVVKRVLRQYGISESGMSRVADIMPSVLEAAKHENITGTDIVADLTDEIAKAIDATAYTRDYNTAERQAVVDALKSFDGRVYVTAEQEAQITI